MDSRRAWFVWSIGVAAYTVAILQRTSFGVAGIAATDRFGATASLLSLFTVVQLLVYAGLQIPVGVLLDRLGPRVLVAAGAACMAAGQIVLAFAGSVPLAISGRVFVGAGDAMTFISVLRLVPSWFGPARVPVMSQVTSIVGQSGQILSAVPFLALLTGPGWTAAFLSAGAVGVLACVLALAGIRDAPGGRVPPRASLRLGEVVRSVNATWRNPGTRLGFWTHWSTMFTPTVFALLWGVPFVVSGLGYSAQQVSVLLTLFVILGAGFGPVLGALTGRHPLRRSWLVLGVVGTTAAAWVLVLAWPGHVPYWALLVLIVVMACAGPASMIGFDYARTANRPADQGTASGIVNVGGFTATLTTMLLVGVLLDVQHRLGGAELYARGPFEVALSVQFVVMGVGVAGVLRCRAQSRRLLAASGHPVPRFRDAWARNRRDHRLL